MTLGYLCRVDQFLHFKDDVTLNFSSMLKYSLIVSYRTPYHLRSAGGAIGLATFHVLSIPGKRSVTYIGRIYSVSQKNPPCGFLTFFPNGWEFLNKFFHTYYTFFSTLNYKFLFNYLQLWRSYAILSATTQRIFTFH